MQQWFDALLNCNDSSLASHQAKKSFLPKSIWYNFGQKRLPKYSESRFCHFRVRGDRDIIRSVGSQTRLALDGS